MGSASLAEYSAKRIMQLAHARRYDRNHKRQALKAVHTIEEFNFQKLSRQQKRAADDYAAEVFGKTAYAPWLYVYTLVSEGFKEGWIPDNFFGSVVCPKINVGIGTITAYKTFTNTILRTDSIPDLYYYIDGIFYNKDLAVIKVGDLRKIAAAKFSYLFVKKDESGRGVGVVKLDVSDLSEEAFKSIGNCVIQYPIQQHKFFDEIITGSVATLRITTVRELDGKIGLRASYLRLGRKNTQWVQSANSVRVAVRDKAGELDVFGYTSDWRRWPGHPDTNVSFSNKRIPQFKEAVDTCLKLHASVPHLSIIGWDVSISSDEQVKLIEWNGLHCDIKFSEATTGPCFLGLNWEKIRN
jgi:hypothetical protein